MEIINILEYLNNFMLMGYIDLFKIYKYVYR